MVFFNPSIVNAAEILADDFEYGADTTTCTETEALSNWTKWRFCTDRSTNPTDTGYFGISSLQKHSGSQSLLMRYLPSTYNGQTITNLETYNTNMGSDIWIDMWVYPVYEEAGMLSGSDPYNKWIYAYTDQAVQNAGHWCVKIGPRRYTGTSNQDMVEPMPDDHTGFFVSFNQKGCATVYSGQNLSGVYMPFNTWSRLVVHVNSSDSVSPNAEMWIDPGTGRLVKVAEHTLTWSDQPAGAANGTIDNYRIKLGTTWPGAGQSTNYYDAWVFVDDFKLATSRSDIDLPPAIPQSLK